MARTETYEAMVLRTHDVGEADRFCILFTRERGLLTARARGARKLKSRLGGSLLPLHPVSVQLAESGAGHTVVGAQQRRNAKSAHDMVTFLHHQEGIEILLAVLHDEEPLPEVFDLVLAFLEKPAVLPFTIRLLTLLGLVSPESFGPLPAAEHAFVRHCCAAYGGPPPVGAAAARRCATVCQSIVAEQSGRTLRASGISAAMLRG